MSRRGSLGIIGIVTLALFLTLSGWVYLGFFHPDPLYVSSDRGGSLTLLSKIVKVIFPVLILVICGIFVLARRGVLGALQLGLILVGLVIGGLALLFAGSEIYYFKTASRSTEEYHTYLQLKPTPLELRSTTQGEEAERIFCLGGSTTAWSDSQGQHWTEMLERELNKTRPGRKIEVYNQGKEWYTSLHSLINYETNLRQHPAKTLLVMHAINDLMHNADFGVFSNGAFREDYGNYLGPATTLIKRHTFEGVLLANFKHLWNHVPRREISTQEFPGLKGFVRNFETIAELAALDGTKVVFMTEPYIFRAQMTPEERNALSMLNTEAIGEDRQWSLATILSGMQQYNSAIKSLEGRHGARVIDVEAAIPKNLEYFKDDVHYTDKTFPLLTTTIASSLP